MPFIKQFSKEHTSKIIELYIKTFSSGQSEQYIDMTELKLYIDFIQENGHSLLAIENEDIVGALLSCPLVIDKTLPSEISNNFSIEKCIYVAEMMVTESARGKGIGTKLLNEFFSTVDKSLYSDAFIRVWDQNIGAVSLYQKVGFEIITSIEQTKKKTDGNGTFVMKKIYLHKKLV
jgi:ribosomal protein S18 acetylase RimI-like enzyme